MSRISVAPFTSQSGHEQNLRYFQSQLQSIVSKIDTNTPAQDRQLYEEALQRAPDDTLLRGNYAQFLEITKSRAEAIAQGQQICELLPDLAWPYYYVGALMVREGRLEEAASYFEQALEIRDDFVQARRELERIRSEHSQVPGQ